MIQSEFKNKPGASLVMQKLYQIVSPDGQLVTKDNWENIALPGSTVAMSMIMRNLRVRGSQCPRPGCFGDGNSGSYSVSIPVVCFPLAQTLPRFLAYRDLTAQSVSSNLRQLRR